MIIFQNNPEFNIPSFWFTQEVLADLSFFLEIWLVATIVCYIFTIIIRKSQKFGKIFLYLTAPGTIIHELSHYIACILTGVKVAEVQFFDKERGGGGVDTVNISEKNPITTFHITFAPLISGSAIVFYSTRFLETANIPYWQSTLIAWCVLSLMCSIGPSYPDVRIFLYSIIASYKKTLKDVGIVIVSVIIYAIIGESLVKSLGEVFFVHFLVILGIILALNLVLKIIFVIVQRVLGDLGNNRKASMIKPMVDVNDLYSKKRRLRNNTVFSEKRTQDFYDSLIDDSL